MMLTVWWLSAIFVKTWKSSKVSEALDRLLKVLIIAINAPVTLWTPPALVRGWRSLVSIWEKADRLPRPCSYIVGVFDLINMLSLIHLLNLLLSCSTISLASQFIIWLFWQTWSVMADLWCSLVEALRVDLLDLCSVILVPGCLPISPMYTFSHWLHGILYTTPAFFSLSTLSFGWTKTCLRVVWGLTTVFSPWMSMGQSPLPLIFLVLYLSWVHLF